MEASKSFKAAEMCHRFGSKHDFERYVRTFYIYWLTDIVFWEPVALPATIVDGEQRLPKASIDRCQESPPTQGSPIRKPALLRWNIGYELVALVQEGSLVHEIHTRWVSKGEVARQEVLLQCAEHIVRRSCAADDRTCEQVAVCRSVARHRPDGHCCLPGLVAETECHAVHLM